MARRKVSRIVESVAQVGLGLKIDGKAVRPEQTLDDQARGGVGGVEVGDIVLERGIAVGANDVRRGGKGGVEAIGDGPTIRNAIVGGGPDRGIKAILIFLEKVIPPSSQRAAPAPAAPGLRMT